MVQRLTLRCRLSCNTKSNSRRIVCTPGGCLVYQYLKKNKTVQKCVQFKEKLKGIRPLRNSVMTVNPVKSAKVEKKPIKAAAKHVIKSGPKKPAHKATRNSKK